MSGGQTISPDEVIAQATHRLLIATCGSAYDGSTLKALTLALSEIERLRGVIRDSTKRQTAIISQFDRLNRVLQRHPDWLAGVRIELEYGPATGSPADVTTHRERAAA